METKFRPSNVETAQALMCQVCQAPFLSLRCFLLSAVIEVVWEDELEKAGGSGDVSMAPEAVKVEER
jgi:hypothetical protein